MMDNLYPDTINISSIQNTSKEPSIKSQINSSIKSQSLSINADLSNTLTLPPIPLHENHIRISTEKEADKAYGTPSTVPAINTDKIYVESQHTLPIVPLEETYMGTPTKLPSIPLDRSDTQTNPKLPLVPVPANNMYVTSPSQSINQPDQKEMSPERQSIKSLIKPEEIEEQGMKIKNHLENLTEVISRFSKSTEGSQSPLITSNIDKIANMSRMLTNEANALRQSIKSLSNDIARTKQEIYSVREEDVNFPYHLFLVEIIINKIHMKCECFDFDYNNLIIAATFLGKQPIILYDPSYGKIDNFNKLNVGKSTLFAITYDKICSLQEFEIVIQLTKQPPCSSCVTKIAETRMDCTKEFLELREELCKKWMQEQPKDNIICTTSTPLSRNLYYLLCGDSDLQDSIGVIEVTTRMSFLGKEITTAFCASPRPKGTSFLLKEDNGISMYSCQKVEMDDQGKILLDESSVTKKSMPSRPHSLPPTRDESPTSQISSLTSSRKSNHQSPYYHHDGRPKYPKYNEIFTKMNANELKIRVPKSSKFERMGKYDKIQELCSCESTPYNSGEQIQFELPKDLCNSDNTHNTYSSNLKYTFNGCDKSCYRKDRRIINVTPTNCSAPVAMEKIVHPQKDVFILKIGKKMETKDKKTDLEIELVTPKAPSVGYPNISENANSNISQQCSTSEMKTKSSKFEKNSAKTKGREKSKKVGQKKKKAKSNKTFENITKYMK